MPVYNAEKYLREAVESILNQTFGDFEFIIINDGSTDGSLAILEEYAARDERIRLVSRENRGLIATLNEGIALARAPLIARMDADDISLPERFKKQVAYLEAHPEVAVVGTDYQVIDDRSRVVVLHKRRPSEHKDIVAGLLEGDSCLCHPTVVFRRDAVRALGGYNPDALHAEDYALWLSVIEHHQMANVPVPLVRYRAHEMSVSTQSIETQRETMERFCNEARGRRGLPTDFVRGYHRPTDARSRSRWFTSYGWCGYGQGDRLMALEYAGKALLQTPWHMDAWRLVLFAVAVPRRVRGGGV
jgi:glycosyltransferase involved in cell wall biosynthesis